MRWEGVGGGAQAAGCQTSRVGVRRVPSKGDGTDKAPTRQATGPLGDPRAGQYGWSRGSVGKAGGVDGAPSRVLKPRPLSGLGPDGTAEP